MLFKELDPGCVFIYDEKYCIKLVVDTACCDWETDNAVDLVGQTFDVKADERIIFVCSPREHYRLVDCLFRTK